MLRCLCLFMTLIMTSGCSVITSRKTSIHQPSAETTAAYYFLPKAKIHVQVLEGKGKDGEKKRALNYVETIIVPDESEFFLLHYNQSSLSNDTLTIHLTPNGLLEKVDTTVEDKSGEIIVKLAEVGKEVVKAAMYVSSVGESPSVIRDLIISPSDFSKVNTEVLSTMPENFQIGLEPMVSLSPSSKGENNKNAPGICFRTQIPYRLTFREGEKVIEEHILLLPDGSPKICMSIERAAFVSKVTNLTFDKGILTQVHIEKPSEVLGFMEIPLSIAKAIASVPAELIQIKINYSNKEKDLANARRAELEAKQALLEYLKKMRDTSGTPLD